MGADNLLESDLAFYNERQRRKESSGEKMDEYSVGCQSFRSLVAVHEWLWSTNFL